MVYLVYLALFSISYNSSGKLCTVSSRISTRALISNFDFWALIFENFFQFFGENIILLKSLGLSEVSICQMASIKTIFENSKVSIALILTPPDGR